MTVSQLMSYLKVARCYQLNLTQTEALCIIAEQRNLTVGALATQLGVTTAAITYVADTLARFGFIERRSGTVDRRHIWLEATPLGRAVLENILRRTPVEVETVAAGLAKKQVAAAV